MLSHATYNLLHLCGIFLVFTSLGGLWVLSAKAAEGPGDGTRRILAATHGIGLVIILIAGFGMMARLGIMGGWPLWIWIKLAVWLVVAATPMLLRRARSSSTALFLLLSVIGATAAWAAIFHIGQVP